MLENHNSQTTWGFGNLLKSTIYIELVARSLAQSLLAKLLQVVLLEVAIGAEEYPLGSADLVGLVFDRGQLDLADEVRDLLKLEMHGVAVSVDDGLLAQSVLERRMKRVGDHALAVIVVDLDGIVALQVFQLIEEQEVRSFLIFEKSSPSLWKCDLQ